MHQVTISIKTSNADKLTEILRDISNPKSPNYGKHLTKQEVDRLTSNEEGRDLVISYLSSFNAEVVDRSSNGMQLTVKANIAMWNSCLHTHFFAYKLKSDADSNIADSSNRVYIRARQYSLPETIASQIGHISNTVEFPMELNRGPSHHRADI